MNIPPILLTPHDQQPDPGEFVRATMRWHFSPETGSPFWLERAPSLDFDPLRDIREYADLQRFPDLTGDLRTARVEDLIPRGLGRSPEIIGIYESGGTTGGPKRVVLMQLWLDQLLAWSSDQLDRHGIPQGVNWLNAVPTGPHMVGEVIARQAARRGGLSFSVDLDPRWVKHLISSGDREGAGRYAEHLVDQLGYVLESQDVGVLMITPPVLERLTRRDDLVKLVREKVRAINWVGTHMDADTRDLYRQEIFPEVVLYSGYGSTMILGNAGERPGLGDDDPCVYDPFSPYFTLSVVDPHTGRPVAHGERGQVIMHHLSACALLPNNRERDSAIRIPALPGQLGDSVADVAPLTQEDGGQDVVEGVY
ncbi:hypothetical protein [Kineosporia sp. NBRC 101731]|uniref:hypothetical protein n=1 Tax=Kineosporia sp. NBRC 101731 TaxID=3032199 RepID=UPI0024A4AEE6|nr:hypothetical protein [Kineosporia sp. NBRC 101731]GLY32346.1 phenazine antibiotic biosynthesis protein [Kineosporia sp. NBRC 101731]